MTSSSAATCDVSKRYLVVVLCSIGMGIIHAMRVNVAVTMITVLDKQPHTKVGTDRARESLPDLNWGSRMIGFLHAIFYLGYFITQIPGGYLSTRFSSHKIFGFCILSSCLLNLVVPFDIHYLGFVMTCATRLLQGLCEGLVYPTAYAILRHWSVPSEKSRMGSIVLTGVYVGPVVGLALSGLLVHYVGWSTVFYLHGFFGIIWFMFWWFLSYESPSVHPSIRADELKFILDEQGKLATSAAEDVIPWSGILRSMPVYALYVCNFARSFVFFLLLTNQPAYVNAFGYSLASNGLLCAIPHLMMAMFAALSGPIADCLMRDPQLSATNVRKLFTCVGFGMEAVCLYILVVVNDGTFAMIFLSIGVGLSGFTISGWQINHLDLAPRYASVLAGLTTAIGTIAGMINPIVVGHMTIDQTLPEWQNVFLMTASILAFAVAFYAIFGSGEKQWWADPDPERIRLNDSKDAPEHGKSEANGLVADVGTEIAEVAKDAATLQEEGVRKRSTSADRTGDSQTGN